MRRTAWIYAATTLAIAAASALSLARAQQPEDQASTAPKTLPGSTAPAATTKVTAEARAEAIVPDPARTPLATPVRVVLTAPTMPAVPSAA